MSQPVWSASMITPLQDFDAPLFRTEITVDSEHGEVESARWLVSAQGVFQAYLGGSPVDDDVLSPGWSSYEWRVRYRDYDVTDTVAAADGPVVLGVAVGNGWYRGRLTWKGIRNIYADRAGLIAQLEITFADGHVQTVVTDESWAAGPSAVLAERHLRRRDDRRPARLGRLAAARPRSAGRSRAGRVGWGRRRRLRHRQARTVRRTAGR